jgi:hypothetical protein
MMPDRQVVESRKLEAASFSASDFLCAVAHIAGNWMAGLQCV